MIPDTNQVIRRSVALNPKDIKIVEKTARKKGTGSFSGALRLIIREWDELQRRNNWDTEQIVPAIKSEE